MAGHPTDYESRFCQMLIDHLSEGLSFESFAAIVGVTKKTLYNWRDANPEFLHSKEIGTEKSRLFWEKLGRDNIINSETSLNTGVYVFNMKNRFPDEWRDKQEREIKHEFENRPPWLDAAK